ncbi:MAG: histidine--tRNA ligase [Kiritimatiellae bacterium]|jgi:histidyl-tRNA synthetase|nr:histidine--tRNA ligase [Kiritimatiellia bacterium]HPC19986.1 histidine--tRNA ligase [Kiritimatiellia bacterium]HQN79429.1 histidine--tRNA ligase [Kiritimatiellia bacterium]HQQ60598.1 histidine--tRNA ligase [Kiritimatiellia bacterium]
MSSAHQPVQGMSDIAAPEIRLWQRVEAVAREVLARYGFEELRTPIVEFESVFTRSLGATTDVVQKEMYVFEKGGRHLALRPEGTAGVMRYAAGLAPGEAEGARWYYFGPMFRSERPQAGRRRQFHQCGVECLEPPSPLVDAEVLALQVDLLRAWGLGDCVVRLNTRGAGGETAAVTAGLRAALQPHQADLCDNCRRRFSENVLRVLDCKTEGCRTVVAGLPPVTDFMSTASRDYLAQVAGHLDALGVACRMDPLLVRGLDYYEHTIWEITSEALGAQNAMSGGGRYRIQIGGRELTGVGFAIGLERVISVLQTLGRTSALLPAPPPLVWLVGLGEQAIQSNLALMQQLRAAGLACRMAPGGSLKSQMRAADKSGAAWAVIRGDDELTQGLAALKDLAAGRQESVPLDRLADELIRRAAASRQ